MEVNKLMPAIFDKLPLNQQRVILSFVNGAHLLHKVARLSKFWRKEVQQSGLLD